MANVPSASRDQQEPMTEGITNTHPGARHQNPDPGISLISLYKVRLRNLGSDSSLTTRAKANMLNWIWTWSPLLLIKEQIGSDGPEWIPKGNADATCSSRSSMTGGSGTREKCWQLVTFPQTANRFACGAGPYSR